MLGRLKACSPVFIWSAAPLWLMLSATIERITQSLSACSERFGQTSLISRPDWPRLLNLNGEGSRLPVAVRISLGLSNGSGWPACLASDGLGSHRSTCDGPPDMNRKITRLALAAYIGRRGASGLEAAVASAAVV